jgi:regulation of enolase protein 1 (concanavalin A-like superfamily)
MLLMPPARPLTRSPRRAWRSSAADTLASRARRLLATAFCTRRRLVAALACVAGFGPGIEHAGAQTMPRAAFSIAPGPADLERRVWPADFNRDGRVDLLGAVRGPRGPAIDLMLAIGRGDGTFNEARSTGLAAEPLALADLNRDNRLDVVVLMRSAFAVLPGRGDGTFGTPRPIQPIAPDRFFDDPTAVVGDFTGDGRLDVALPLNGLSVYPGNGDLTFGSPVEVAMPDGVTTAAAGDFNGDGRLDVAAVGFCCALRVLVNTGAGGFAVTEYPINTDRSDLAAADLNGDGSLDLVLTRFGTGGPPSQGHLAVFLGRGDGTFAPAVEYEAGDHVDGEHSLAIGDFTRDGMLDVATANQSTWYDDDFSFQNGDTVTIFAGDGTGALIEPVTFPLGGENGDAYQDRVNFIRAADLDRDGHLDLVTSPAVVFLNRPAVPNRPPTVFLGPDRTHHTEDAISLHAMASDPDGHFLRFDWGGSSPRGPHNAFRGLVEPGVYTVAVTVDDGLGGVATDSVTITVVPWANARLLQVVEPAAGARLAPASAVTVRWFARETEPFDRFDVYYSLDAGRTLVPIANCQALAGNVSQCSWTTPAADTEQALLAVVGSYGPDHWNGISGLFAITDDPPPGPPAWRHRDVGAVGATGDASYDAATGTFTLHGAGADIWGTADEFHYLWRPMGVFAGVEITARVTSVENVNAWTKVGLMVRSHLGPGSPHASIFVTPTTVKGTAFQRRRIDGELSVHTSGPKVTAPVWLRLVMHPDGRVRASVRDGDNPWVLVGEDTITFPDFNENSVLAGLVVGSHVDRTLATATFDGVTITPLRTWRDEDIGAVGRAGTSAATGTRVTLEGSGTDIWGTADAFRFRSVSTASGGDVRVTARVLDVEPTHPWAKAGVMIRDERTPGSPHVMVIVSPGRGVAMQYRAVADGSSANVAVVPGLAPKWVRLTRRGDRFVGEMSDDGAAWQTIGAIDIAMNTSTETGLAVTSHNNGVLATATFEDAIVETPPWP